MTALNNEGPALATPALEDKPITTPASVHLPAHLEAHAAHRKIVAPLHQAGCQS